jgi:cardiolipin synthase
MRYFCCVDAMNMKENIWNVPNGLSAYRIAVFPLMLYFIFSGHRELFFLFLCINLVTDIADGFIARRFKLVTEFGARLDSVADLGTYILAFTGMIVLEQAFVKIHLPEFTLIIGLHVLEVLVSLVRFRSTPHLHLYSAKITGYLQGIFILSYFGYGYIPWYFYGMIVFTCIAHLEELVILLRIPALRSDVKGIYFMLKEQGRIE